MKPREQSGVVDARLNVYGTQNLKVAGMFFTYFLVDDIKLTQPVDCSITPANVGANTYNTALAIGEKAAVIIAEDLGIKGVSSA
jgi:alcohol oxidase